MLWNGAEAKNTVILGLPLPPRFLLTTTNLPLPPTLFPLPLLPRPLQHVVTLVVFRGRNNTFVGLTFISSSSTITGPFGCCSHGLAFGSPEEWIRSSVDIPLKSIL